MAHAPFVEVARPVRLGARRTKHPVLNQPGRTRLKSKDYMRLETVNVPLFDEAGRLVKVACFYAYLFEKQPATV